jgi:serine/threonine-protein kinase
VLVGVSAPPSTTGGLPLPWPELAILVIGVAFSLGVYLLLRRQLPAGAFVEEAAGRLAGDPVAAIGRYALVEQLGQGGMAEIYAAVTTGEGTFRRPVVIKRLRPELIADPGAVSQFCDEANLLAALHHPNIVAVHDFGRAQNQYFLAEEYVAGRNLGRIIERRLSSTRRPLPVEIIAHVGCEILKGLEYAHGLRDGDGRPLAIVHRDVSPENVMVSALGEVKLLDFGVVKAEGRLTKTETGVVKGNVTYMAPEQARGLEVDARADLYSLALVLYFCCAGRPLYAADTTYGLLMKAGAGPGIEERASIRQLPRPFAAVVERATAQRLEERYGSAREMALDLEAWARAGVTLTGTLVTELFGDDLREEAHRLATFAPENALHPVAGVSG